MSQEPINLRLLVRARRTTSSRRETGQLNKWPPEPRGYKHSYQALPIAIPHLLTKVCSATLRSQDACLHWVAQQAAGGARR
jgi:hypothetical protein